MISESLFLHLRNGGMIIIYDSLDRESEGDFAFLGEFVTPERINFLLKHASGLICLAMTEQWARKLGIKRLPSNNKDDFSTPFGYPINAISNASGVSATERSKTIQMASSINADESKFYYPGHVQTLIANPLGIMGRSGHTEAITELSKLCGIDAPGVLCEILDNIGDPVRLPELIDLAKKLDIPLVTIDQIKDFIKKQRDVL